MSNFVAQIWFNHQAEIPSRAGRFCLVEIPNSTFEDLQDDLMDNELIAGDLLITSKATSGGFIVQTRRPILFRGNAVDRCHPADTFQIENNAA